MYRLIDDVAFYTAKEADQRIAQSVQAEAALREASDAACNARIADEAAAREAADAELLDAITDETTAREGDVEALTTSIDVESAVREAADTTLQQHIDSEAAARNEADSAVRGYVDTEVSARKAADNSLQAAIDVETTARKAADTTLQLNIDSEASSREAADTTLQSNIDAEASERSAADANLAANLSAEALARNADITAVRGEVTAETTARESADGDLSTLVTEDKSSLVAAVNELADRNDAVAKIVAGLFQVKDVQSSSGECTVARASIDAAFGSAATLTGASFSDSKHSIVNYAVKINSVSYADGTSFSAGNLEYRICLNTNEQGNTIVHSTGWLNDTGIFYGITGLSQSNYCKARINMRIKGGTFPTKDLKLKYTVVASRVPITISN